MLIMFQFNKKCKITRLFLHYLKKNSEFFITELLFIIKNIKILKYLISYYYNLYKNYKYNYIKFIILIYLISYKRIYYLLIFFVFLRNF